MNHSVKRRHQALHQTHHHYYLNISVEAANLSDWRIESNRKKIYSVARIEPNRIKTFFARIGMLYCQHSESQFIELHPTMKFFFTKVSNISVQVVTEKHLRGRR